jgi:hypothetical protein
MKPEDHYHLGIVVEDYEATLERLTAVFGYRWGDEIDVTMPVRLADGERDLNLRFTYSMDLPRLEIIRVITGTPWVPADNGGPHHMGYWSDDVYADGALLERHGYVREATAGPNESPMFGYYRHRGGPRVELVNVGARPAMESYWATGKFTM